MSSLPILLKDPKVLLIGYGQVGRHKAKVLRENGIDFKVIEQKFSEDDLGDFKIIIDATGSDAVYGILKRNKHKRGLLLNIVDQPDRCDFYFSSLLQYGKLKIAVSSDGASPTLTQCVRQKIRSVIPNDVAKLAEVMGARREQGMIDRELSARSANRLLYRVYLVGCGIGDPELLTLKAYRIIQKVDVVLYDHLISEEIMEIVPSGTRKIFVGKQKGYHSLDQASINKLILEEVEKGRSVARLKSGDPYIFGRGAEEMLYLVKQGVRVDTIPGISSSIAAPLSAGIPVTARGYASSFSVVSAHLRGNRVNLSWIDMLKLKEHTLIVLMGLSRVKEIVEKARREGIDEELPAAIISNASRQDQRTIITTLGQLEVSAYQACTPSVIVFGEVVKISGGIRALQQQYIRTLYPLEHIEAV
jgi:uroporphyrin-III C-methyltransferase/precorrin-2 dehydrogenase/sirohydrochlorin ferrochelatase